MKSIHSSTPGKSRLAAIFGTLSAALWWLAGDLLRDQVIELIRQILAALFS